MSVVAAIGRERKTRNFSEKRFSNVNNSFLTGLDAAKCDEKEIPTFRYSLSKTIAYIVILAIVLVLINILFGWTSADEMPALLQQYSGILLAVSTVVSKQPEISP